MIAPFKDLGAKRIQSVVWFLIKPNLEREDITATKCLPLQAPGSSALPCRFLLREFFTRICDNAFELATELEYLRECSYHALQNLTASMHAVPTIRLLARSKNWKQETRLLVDVTRHSSLTLDCLVLTLRRAAPNIWLYYGIHGHISSVHGSLPHLQCFSWYLYGFRTA